MLDYMSASERRYLRRVISRSVVNNDDFFGMLLRTEDNGPDCWTFVESGNRDQNTQWSALCRNALAGRGGVVTDCQEIPPWGQGAVSVRV